MTSSHAAPPDTWPPPPRRPPLHLTSDLPGIGGRIKVRPEDFLVEEIPLYQPRGSGEHLFLFIEKRAISTSAAINALARHFGVRTGAVGYAGLKDKNAVTRQHLSVHLPGRTGHPLPPFDLARIAVLWTEWHTNKLRPGHHAANRFVIRVRGVDASSAPGALRIIRRLEQTGLPNRTGAQRFGALANNHVIGRALVLGDHHTVLRELLAPSERFPAVQAEARALYAQGKFAEAAACYPRACTSERYVLKALARGVPPPLAIRHIDASQRAYFLTAFQSAVFNAVLDQRLEAGTLATLEIGDLAWKHDSGAVFAADDLVLAAPDTAQRLQTIAISPSGPMWGPQMTRAAGIVAARELAALSASGITPESLERFLRSDRASAAHAPGKRRPLRVPLAFPDAEGGCDDAGPYVRIAFELPPGSFATVVLDEVMKCPPAPQPSAGASP